MGNKVEKFRAFSSSGEFPMPMRNIDSDAPKELRQEFMDIVFHLIENNSPPMNDQQIYMITDFHS